MTTTVTSNTSDRQLLAEVSRWRKANGWGISHRGWINAPYSGAATVAINYDEHRDGFTVSRKDERVGTWPLYGDFYPADNIRQAVEMLVAIGILPAQFSSAYKAGWHDGFFHTVEDETRSEIRASWSPR